MKISVILPVYNGRQFLMETLDSVFRQTLRASEVIAVDDGSTDDSMAVLQQYEGRVRVFSQDNAGVSAARNRGVSVAEGDLIAFIDQDDVWYPHKLEQQLETYLSNGHRPLVYSDLDLIDNRGKITGNLALGDLSAKWMCPFIGGHLHPYPSTVLMAKSLFLEEGGFDPELRGNGHEDVDFWIRLYPRTPFILIPQALIKYRTDPRERRRKTRNLAVESANGFRLYDKIEPMFRNDPSKKTALDRLLSVAHANLGKAKVRSGDLQSARKHFKEAYRIFPQHRKNQWRYWRTFLPAWAHPLVFSR